MTSGWNEAISNYNIREGEMILFCFTPKKKGKLDLLIVGSSAVYSEDEQQTSEEGHQMSEDD
jgi:hypothetical protein